MNVSDETRHYANYANLRVAMSEFYETASIFIVNTVGDIIDGCKLNEIKEVKHELCIVTDDWELFTKGIDVGAAEKLLKHFLPKDEFNEIMNSDLDCVFWEAYDKLPWVEGIIVVAEAGND